MIGHDAPMVLVAMRKSNGHVVQIYDLGYSVLDSSEMDRLQLLAESKGIYLYLTESKEVHTYASLYQDVGGL